MAQLRINPSGPLRGAITLPGDKSISHRALLLGALADGATRVRGWLPAEDCQATLRCVRALGISVDQESDAELVVHGGGMQGLREPVDVLDCGGSGTTMRLLAGILAGQPFTSVMTGNSALRKRPMGRVAEPLRQMGATILGRQDGRLPPLTIRGGGLNALEYTLPIASAQVKSAVLLAGLFAHGETVIHEPGPARDHTERMLRAFGVEVEVAGPTVRLRAGQSLRALGAHGGGGLYVPADFSSAAFPIVASAIIPGSEVWVRDVGVNPTRTGLYDLLGKMGAALDLLESDQDQSGGIGEPVANIVSLSSGLRAIEISGEVVVRAIDEFPILAVAACRAEGTTVVREARELRVKETDRIAAVAQELRKMGADVEETADGMIVHGPTALRGAEVHSHGDHRLAMALAVAGLAASSPTTVEYAEVINDSFPGFVESMCALGADVSWV